MTRKKSLGKLVSIHKASYVSHWSWVWLLWRCDGTQKIIHSQYCNSFVRRRWLFTSKGTFSTARTGSRKGPFGAVSSFRDWLIDWLIPSIRYATIPTGNDVRFFFSPPRDLLIQSGWLGLLLFIIHMSLNISLTRRLACSRFILVLSFRVSFFFFFRLSRSSTKLRVLTTTIKASFQ